MKTNVFSKQKTDTEFFGLLLGIFLALQCSYILAEQQTRIFNLRGDPQQLEQSINKLYGDQARLSLVNKQLAVRAEPAVLDQIGKLLGEMDSAPKVLSISLSSVPQGKNNTISTQSGKDIYGLKTENGKTVVLSKARLRQQPVIGSWYQVGIEEAPIDEENLSITPELTGGEVRVQINYRLKNDSQLSSGSQTITGKPGEWISLMGGELTKADYSKNISVRKLSTGHTNQLWIKIDTIE